MCLLTSNKQFFVSDREMVAYKTVIKRSDGTYITPYQHFHIWKLGEEFHVLDREKLQDDIPTNVYGGVFHLFKNPVDAFVEKKWFEHIPDFFNKNVVVLKAVIPKGTRFIIGTYKGVFYLGNPTEVYGAESVIYQEEIECSEDVLA